MSGSNLGQKRIIEGAAAPPNTVTVIQTIIALSNGTVDDTFLIPDLNTLTIQAVAISSQAPGSVLNLFIDEDGDLLNLIQLGIPLFASASNFEAATAQDVIGNGTRRILMRISAVGAGTARQINGLWRGFYQVT